MGRIQFDQGVMYANGQPATNIAVQVFDLDVGGNGDDSILNTVTNSSGHIVGQSSEWEDANTLKTSQRVLAGVRMTADIPPRFEPIYKDVEIEVEVPDVPVLKYVLTRGSDRFEVVVPAPPLGLAVTTPPIVLPWTAPLEPRLPRLDPDRLWPRQLAIGAVNGRAVYQPLDWRQFIIEDADAGKPLVIEVMQPDVVGAFRSFVDRFREGAFNRVTASVVGADDALVIAAIGAAIAQVIVAIGGLVLATGVAVTITILALSVLYAVHKGYTIDDVTMEFGPAGVPTKMTIKMSAPALRG